MQKLFRKLGTSLALSCAGVALGLGLLLIDSTPAHGQGAETPTDARRITPPEEVERQREERRKATIAAAVEALRTQGPDRAEAATEWLLKNASLAEIREALSSQDYQTIYAQYQHAGIDGGTRSYWVRVPDGYDPARSYPLLVTMHGGVSGAGVDAGEGNLSMWDSYLPEDWKRDFILMSPSARSESDDEARIADEDMWWGTVGMTNVLGALREVKSRYNVDDNRVFVSGFSDGASGTFSFAARRPDAFAGFFPLSGHPLVPELSGSPIYGENFIGKNIYVVNGGKDTLYPSERVRTVIDEINKCGAYLQFTDYPDAPHRPTYFPEELPKIGEQMRKWQRDSVPSVVDWSCTDDENGICAYVRVLAIHDLSEMGINTIKPASRAEPSSGDDNGETPVRLGITPDNTAVVATIGAVSEGSLAAKMGLMVGDVFKTINDMPATTTPEILAALGQCKIGGKITVVVERNGFEVTASGIIPKPEPRRADPVDREQTEARVRAELTPGSLTIASMNALSLEILVAPQMLDVEGNLVITVNGVEAYRGAPKADPKFVLRQYRETLDRSLPWITSIEIMVDELDYPEAAGE